MEYHYINNEDKSLFYDIDHNDSDDEVINTFLLLRKYGDIVNTTMTENDRIESCRFLMMWYERYAKHLENILDQYLYWIFEYRYFVVKQGVEHIALMYHYCRYLNNAYYAGYSFITNEVEDITYNDYISTILSYGVLSNIVSRHIKFFKSDISNHNEIHKILEDNFTNTLTYDNILSIDWLTTFFKEYAESIDLVNREIELHEKEIDNYV